MNETLKEKINSFAPVDNNVYTLISVSLGKFLYGFYTTAIGLMLVPMGEALNIPVRIQSIIFPFNYFGQIVIVFFVGFFTDRLGKKFIHSILFILLSISALIFTYISSYYLFLILFFFMGIFSSSINMISDATVSDTFNKNKGFYLNIAHIFFGLGGLTSPILFNFIFTTTGDFRTIYFMLFIICFLILMLTSFAKYPLLKNKSIKLNIIGRIFKKKNFTFLMIYMIIASGTPQSISSWIPTLFQKYLNVSAQVSSYSLSFFWLSIIIGRLLTALFLKKFSELNILKTLNICIFILISFSYFLSNHVFLLIDYFLTGIALGGIIPLGLSYSSEIHPENTGTRIALLFAGNAIGMLIMPTIVGLLADLFLIHKVISFNSLFFLFFIFIFHKKF